MKILKNLVYFDRGFCFLTAFLLALGFGLDQSMANSDAHARLVDETKVQAKTQNSWTNPSQSENQEEQEVNPLSFEAKILATGPLKSHQMVELEINANLKSGFKAYVDQFKLTAQNPTYIDFVALNPFPTFKFFDRFSNQNKVGVRDQFKISSALKIPTVLESYPEKLTLSLTYQACTETYCLFPKDIYFEVPVTWEKTFFETRWPEQANNEIDMFWTLIFAAAILFAIVGILLIRPSRLRLKKLTWISIWIALLIFGFLLSTSYWSNLKYLSNFADPRPRISWIPYTEEILQTALTSGKPVFIELFATWCSPCLQMKDEVFTDLSVIYETDQFVALKLDATEESEVLKQFKRNYQIDSLPAVIFFDKTGKRLPTEDLFSYESAENFVSRLRRVESK